MLLWYTFFMSNKTTAFYAALCLFFSAIEYAIPKPIPFLRLGLANLPILIALTTLDTKQIGILVVFKIIGQALLTGTIFSYIFIFSAAGSIASATTMVLIYNIFKKTGLLSNISLSLSGALSNNAAQLFCSHFLIFGENTKYIAPVLLISGLITGTVLGVIVNIFEEKSKWYHLLLNPTDFSTLSTNIKENPNNKDYKSIFIFIIAFVIIVIFMLLHSLWIKIAFSICFFVILEIKKKGKVKVLPSIILLISVTFFSLLNPSGEILFSIGLFNITKGALLNGLNKSITLVGMVFVSQIAINKNLYIPGKIGSFISLEFSYFEQLTSKKVKFTKKNIIDTIDNHLIEIWESI